MSCTSTDPCGQPQYSSDSVNYVGPNLVCTTIETCDTVTEAFQKAEAKVCSLQSTLVLLQNQLNSLTTTTSTSSTSSTSTTSTTSSSTTTTTTTTAANPTVFYSLQAAPGVPSDGTYFSFHYRINGGIWYEFYQSQPNFYCGLANTFPAYSDYFAWLPVNDPRISGLSPAWPIGAFIEIAVTRCVVNNPINVRFGAGQNSGQFTTYCGKATPYGFIWNGGQNIYINVAITSGNTVVC